MIGSKLLANSFERPSTKPSGVPNRQRQRIPLATSHSEYQAKRRP
jgi:hypothetical protein